MSQIATPATGVEKSRKALNRAVIRFAGDSGDGMQLTGEQFTTESAWAGNDLATLPNFPAEIRAPADRKSTRLNSSHGYISYAVFCLKKKKDMRYRNPSIPRAKCYSKRRVSAGLRCR